MKIMVVDTSSLQGFELPVGSAHEALIFVRSWVQLHETTSVILIHVHKCVYIHIDHEWATSFLIWAKLCALSKATGLEQMYDKQLC